MILGALPIEPPLLIPSRSLEDVAPLPAPPEEVAKVEADLARAKRNAASSERMFRAGIISKVESEERVLKVVRLEAKVAEARLEAMRSRQSVQTAQVQVTEVAPGDRASDDQIADAARAADEAAAEKKRAEKEAALRNLARQKKLLALGSGRKADVNRAAEKVAELEGQVD